MDWFVVLSAGLIGGLGVSGLIASAFERDHWAGFLNRASPGWKASPMTSIGLAGGAGIIAVALCLIAVALSHNAAAVAIAAVVAILVGLVVYMALRSKIAWLAGVSLPLSLVLLAIVLIG